MNPSRINKKKIARNLENTLLKNAPFSIELYEWELEECVPDYFKSKQQDEDAYFIAATELENDVAMLLIDEQNNLHVNEAARDELKRIWHQSYEDNIKILIPQMAQNLLDGYIWATGVKWA